VNKLIELNRPDLKMQNTSDLICADKLCIFFNCNKVNKEKKHHSEALMCGARRADALNHSAVIDLTETLQCCGFPSSVHLADGLPSSLLVASGGHRLPLASDTVLAPVLIAGF